MIIQVAFWIGVIGIGSPIRFVIHNKSNDQCWYSDEGAAFRVASYLSVTHIYTDYRMARKLGLQLWTTKVNNFLQRVETSSDYSEMLCSSYYRHSTASGSCKYSKLNFHLGPKIGATLKFKRWASERAPFDNFLSVE